MSSTEQKNTVSHIQNLLATTFKYTLLLGVTFSAWNALHKSNIINLNDWISENNIVFEFYDKSTVDENQKKANVLQTPALINTYNYLKTESSVKNLEYNKKLIMDLVVFYQNTGLIKHTPRFELQSIPFDLDYYTKNSDNPFIYYPLKIMSEKSQADFLERLKKKNFTYLLKNFVHDINSNLDTPEKTLNCTMNIAYDQDNDMFVKNINLYHNLYEYILNSQNNNIEGNAAQKNHPNINVKHSTPFSKLENAIFQEFIFLHEYFHCHLYFKSYKEDLYKSMLGARTTSQEKLSSYLYGAVAYSHKGDSSFEEHPAVRTVEEKFVDILAWVTLINKYGNNTEHSNQENINALSTIMDEMYHNRLFTQLFEIDKSSYHNGYEIYFYLSNPEIISNILRLKTPEEMYQFSIETLQHANNWRTLYDMHSTVKNLELSKSILKTENFLVSSAKLKLADNLDDYMNSFIVVNKEGSLLHDVTKIFAEYSFYMAKNNSKEFNSIKEEKGFINRLLHKYQQFYDLESLDAKNFEIAEQKFGKYMETRLGDKPEHLEILEMTTIYSYLKFAKNYYNNTIKPLYSGEIKFSKEQLEAQKYLPLFYKDLSHLYGLSPEKIADTYNQIAPVDIRNYLLSYLQSKNLFTEATLDNSPPVVNTAFEDAKKIPNRQFNLWNEDISLDTPIVPETTLSLGNNLLVESRIKKYNEKKTSLK